MFRRKRSSSHHQPLSTTSSQSAQSAASHAFLQSQPSSSSLSSAAAAAALRSLTPTPQPIENVQTKRIQRRASIASQPSPSGASFPTQALRRVNSSSSMSSRTFRREQSPGCPNTGSSSNDAPPLPPMPSQYTLRKSPPGSRRSFSMGPPLRTMSPPRRTGTRGSSLDRGAMRSSPGRPTSSRSQGSLGHGTLHETERPASRNSVNFSYPMNSRPNSPSPPPSPLNRPEVSASLAQRLSESPVQPPADRTAKLTKGSTDKRSLTGAAEIGQPRTAVAAAKAAIVPIPTASRDQDLAPSRPAIVKRPSTVKEDYQGEERAEANTRVNGGVDCARAENAPPSVEQDRSPTIRATVTPEPQIIKSPPTPERISPPLLEKTVTSPVSSNSVEQERDAAKPSRVRQASTSPGRSARFSTQLSVAGELHNPPPRSVSPVKSAMKHSPHGSLSPDRVPGTMVRSGIASSDISDGTSVGSDDGLQIGSFKRKPVKVSFDDEAEVVGIAASPPTSPEDILPESPPGRSKSKTTWGKKKTAPLGSVINKDEFDEVLKPRPALPSFGGIRAMRNGDVHEATQEEPNDNESTASSDSNAVSPVWDFSNDHAIGGILTNAQPENGQNLAEEIEHPPLPSPTKATDASDRADQVNKMKEFMPVIRPAWVDGMQSADFTPKPTQNVTPPSLAVPAIAVESATPEKGRSSLEAYNVPGGFPRTSMEFDSRTAGTRPGKGKSNKSHDRSGSGSSISFDESGKPVANGKGADDESDGSVYSDAAEGFDEGNGFGSINAIVDEQAAHPYAIENTNPYTDVGTELATVPEEESQQMIGRAVSPPLISTIPYPPDSPDTVNEPLPFSSPYPPFPLKRKPKAKPTSEGVARSNTTANRTQRRASVAGIGGVSPGQGASNGAPQDDVSMRQRTGAEKKRPVSMGPSLPNGKVPGINGGHKATNTESNGFKRSDTASPGKPEGGYAMRRTMRSSSQQPRVQFSPERATPPRPLSSGSSTGGTGMMRATLRNGTNKGEKTSFFSTAKSPSKSPNRKKLSRPSNLFSSRFDNSDEEAEEDHLREFRSRFADSSDEDEDGPNTLRPVRGIPRQSMQDGESTELEDSSDDEKRWAKPKAATSHARKPSDSGSSNVSGLGAVAKNRGVSREELEDFLHQPSRKPGIFNRLSRRKPRNPEPKLRKPTPEAVPENPVAHSRGGSVTTTVTASVPENSQLESAGQPKTQRRGSKIFNGNDGWPLRTDREPANDAISKKVDNAGPPAGGDDRTAVEANGATSPGQLGGEGSHFPKRQPTSTSARDVVIAAAGRKKRFPKLRRAFGLS